MSQAEYVLEYPDVNKNPDGSESYLCWVAAASNALFYTEWAAPPLFNSAEEVFREVVDRFGNFARSGMTAFKFFFREILGEQNNVRDYIKIYPPSLMWRLKDIKQNHQCGIVSLWYPGFKYTHLMAFYEIYSLGKANQFKIEDPRHYNQIKYSDSDDGVESNFLLDIKYDINTKQFSAYDDRAYIYYLILVNHRH